MYIQVHILGGGSLLYRKELDGIHPTVFIISVPKYKIFFLSQSRGFKSIFFRHRILNEEEEKQQQR